MMWIIMVHTLSYGKPIIGNRAIAYEMSDNFFMQIVNNGTLSLDTFFFMSGFMLTKVFLKKQLRATTQKSLKTKLKGFLLSIGKRYIRITPAYFILILATILNFSWHEKISLFSISEEANVLCSKYWWRNLFYINNLFEWDEICLTWSWYLSNDMQYFIFGSFLLILSVTHFNYAAGIAGVSLGSSIFLNGYTAYSIHYVPTLDEEMETYRFLYTRPWLRISPYLLGMGTAQLLTRWNYTLQWSKKMLAVCWILAIFCNCSVLFGLINKSIPLGLSVLYTAFSRTSWGVGISWLVIACCTNNGGFVTKFLSLKLWIPLSRTTYCCYLVHPFVIISIYRLGSYPVYTDASTTGTMFLGMLVASYISAFVLSAIAEVPYMHLQKILVESIRRT
ncbi:nose resistant to fluoxetine protein 6-like [Xylocopa sonorina]|uniref:nose resistant to fluoxetine protein 6-like n=1 Tax=Xylocopa sonorina TaxID=1818115 RepID=UPI00403AF03F